VAGSSSAIFATVVGVLAGLAVIGAVAFVAVWEWWTIRRTLATHRRQPPEAFWRAWASVTVPERRP
jgi:uncharacterized membrane protein YebE (DUF533 family)